VCALFHCLIHTRTHSSLVLVDEDALRVTGVTYAAPHARVIGRVSHDAGMSRPRLLVTAALLGAKYDLMRVRAATQHVHGSALIYTTLHFDE
jgi:hypothetical protein